MRTVFRPFITILLNASARVMQMLRFYQNAARLRRHHVLLDNKVLGSNRPVAEIAREMSC